jgi:hypothetical protein
MAPSRAILGAGSGLAIMESQGTRFSGIAQWGLVPAEPPDIMIDLQAGAAHDRPAIQHFRNQ